MPNTFVKKEFKNLLSENYMKEFEQEYIELFRELLQKTLESGVVASWTLDLNTYHVHGDEVLFNLFDLDYPTDGLLPLPYFVNSIHPNYKEEVMLAINASIKNRSDYEIEYKLIPQGETERWVLAYGRVDNLTSPTKFIGFMIDITDKKHLEIQKQQLQRDLPINNKEFQNIASHELKMPLTSLKASLQLLGRIFKNDPFSEKASFLLSKANRNVAKLDSLIPDLLNLPKAHEGKLRLNKSLISLSEIIANFFKQSHFLATHEIIVTNSLEVKLNADAERLEQVLINFVDNAIRYAPSSQEIFITVEKKDDMVKVFVKDNGPGIAAEKIPFLFDRFFRIKPLNTNCSGLGLGLYISAEIIKAHQGNIGVESEAGKGSTFWFTIPLN